jgi:hypothetical protein
LHSPIVLSCNNKTRNFRLIGVRRKKRLLRSENAFLVATNRLLLRLERPLRHLSAAGLPDKQQVNHNGVLLLLTQKSALTAPMLLKEISVPVVLWWRHGRVGWGGGPLPDGDPIPDERL